MSFVKSQSLCIAQWHPMSLGSLSNLGILCNAKASLTVFASGIFLLLFSKLFSKLSECICSTCILPQQDSSRAQAASWISSSPQVHCGGSNSSVRIFTHPDILRDQRQPKVQVLLGVQMDLALQLPSSI
mmetsp:Transcript_13735/g.19063  ORF Transcript_13735/g.19063 Transcript_13735/m.19063 type:complete len:129 (-) Transcript_13735:3040-3426(-)